MERMLLINYSGHIMLGVPVPGAFSLLGWLISLTLRRLGRDKPSQRNRAYRLIAVAGDRANQPSLATPKAGSRRVSGACSC